MSQLKINHFSPQGLLRWAHLFEPDTTGKYADDKYKVDLRLYGDEAKAFKKLLDDLAAEAKTAENSDADVKPRYTKAKDKDGKVIPGAIDVKFKSLNPITVLDGKKNKLMKNQVPGYKPNCMPGEGIVIFQPVAMTVSGTTHLVLYLQGVQICKLSTSYIDLDALEEIEDGFEAEAADTMVDDNEEDEDDMPDFASK